jgi:hypothetical protein
VAYTPNPVDPTQPLGSIDASTAAPEFRALKAYIQTLVLTSGNTSGERQAIQDGAKDYSGNSIVLAASFGNLALDLQTVAASIPYPLCVNFAGGQAGNGNNDRIGYLTNDIAQVVSGLEPNNTNYIYADWVSVSNFTWEHTLNPPQYDVSYDNTKSILCHFLEFSGFTTQTLDDYGKFVNLTNAIVSSTRSKFGGTSLLFNGTTALAEVVGLTEMPRDSWTFDFWVNWNGALPTAGVNDTLAGLYNTTDFGVQIKLNNTAGTMKLSFSASSNGTSFNIAAASLGSNTTWALNTWYHIEVTYDALAGKYFVYKDGVQDISVTSASRICSVTLARFGRFSAGTPEFFDGYMDEYRLSPYCRHSNGTTFTPPTAASAVEGDFFDIQSMKMYTITGASQQEGVIPTRTSRYRLYFGEADTGTSSVSAVRNYAFNGRYVGPFVTPLPAVSTSFSQAHNIGAMPRRAKLTLENILTDAGYTPGTRIVEGYTTDGALGRTLPIRATPTSIAATTCSATAHTSVNASTGASVALTVANWKYRFEADRGW